MNTPGNTTDGSPWVGTNVFARNVNGNSHPNVVWSASVGLDTDRPTSVPTQIIANPNNTSSPYAPAAGLTAVEAGLAFVVDGIRQRITPTR